MNWRYVQRSPFVRFLALLCALLGLCPAAEAQSLEDLLSGHFRVRGAVTAFYEELEQPPAMVLRIESAYTDYQRKGFFRIGLLPMGVLDGVTLELNHPEFYTNSLVRFNRWVGAPSPNALELRRLALVVPLGDTNRLESARARLIPGGRIELFDGVRFLSGTNRIIAARGLLQVTGSSAGEFVLNTIPPWTNNLLALRPNQKTQRINKKPE